MTSEPAPTPSSISVNLPRHTLRSTTDNGLQKSHPAVRFLHSHTRCRVKVYSTAHGTSDTMFYVPETPSANSSARATPVQFVKTSANDTPDLVHASHAFQISFVGMSVTPHDLFANNELLLCSIRKRSKLSDLSSNTSLTSSSTQPSVNTALTSEEDAETMPTVQKKDPPKSLHPSFTLRPDDIPFIHYDPVIDGHDVGSRPDTFVPVPGSKRLYLQRAGTREANICVRFTVMEIDKLSEEQMAAVKSIENLGQSVGKAAATIPYLKPVGWLLKMANFFGKSAMRKLSNPDHVISRDVAFLVAGAGSETNLEGRSEARSAVGTVTDEPYGNYLRYGYYFFLNKPVDAQLYAQTGSSSESVSLLLRRHGFKSAKPRLNEKEFVPLTGVSYVVIKVTRGFTEGAREERREMLEQQRERLETMLRKYGAGDNVAQSSTTAVANDKAKVLKT